MNATASELLQLLRREAAALGGLLATAQPEREALLSFELDQLRRIGARRQTILIELGAYEKTRAEILRRLSGELRLPHRELTLEEVARRSPEPLAAGLRACRKELLGLEARLREESERTRAFCRHGLETVQGSFRMLQQIFGGGPTYERSGQMQGSRVRGRLLLESY